MNRHRGKEKDEAEAEEKEKSAKGSQEKDEAEEKEGMLDSVNGHWETEFRKLGDFGYVDNVCDHWLLLIGW